MLGAMAKAASKPSAVIDTRVIYCGDNLEQLRKQPFAIRVLTWFAALASAGMYLSILLAILDIGPQIMGGERVTHLLIADF
jgi:hypothetical protein